MKIRQMIKALTVGVAVATASSVASAAPINIGGVVFNPDSIFDFVTKGGMFERVISTIGDTVAGFGQITEINQTSESQFCPTCELTYTFGGFTLVDPNPSALLFTGGWVNFYVQDKSAPDFTAYDPTKANGNGADGALWLSLEGHTDQRTGYSAQGTLFGKIDAGTLGTGTERGAGGGMLDVTGGLAAGNIDTNSVKDSLGGSADLNFNSDFQPTAPEAIAAGAPALTGGATFRGNSIPEPGTLMLLGVGLLGLGIGGMRRKQRKG